MRDAATTSRIMAAVRSTGTRPEMMLRKELWRRGLRYRVRTKMTGHPDIVFPGPRVAVFIDGEFWHGAGWRERGFTSMEQQFKGLARADWWIAKIRRNMERDSHVTQRLEADGWRVMRFWESQVRADLGGVADDVESAVRTTKPVTR